MCRWSTSTFENLCGCTALDMQEWRKTTEQIDWRARQPSQVACFSVALKCWKAWDTTSGHKAKDMVESGSAGRSSMKGRERVIVSQTKTGTVSKATLGETGERRGGAHMGFSDHIDTLLNWTELNFRHSSPKWTINGPQYQRFLLLSFQSCSTLKYSLVLFACCQRSLLLKTWRWLRWHSAH